MKDLQKFRNPWHVGVLLGPLGPSVVLRLGYIVTSRYYWTNVVKFEMDVAHFTTHWTLAMKDLQKFRNLWHVGVPLGPLGLSE